MSSWGLKKIKNVGPYIQVCFIRIIEAGAETLYFKSTPDDSGGTTGLAQIPFSVENEAREITFPRFPLVAASGRAGTRTQVIT